MTKHCSAIPQVRSAQDRAWDEMAAELFRKVRQNEMSPEDAQKAMEDMAKARFAQVTA